MWYFFFEIRILEKCSFGQTASFPSRGRFEDRIRFSKIPAAHTRKSSNENNRKSLILSHLTYSCETYFFFSDFDLFFLLLYIHTRTTNDNDEREKSIDNLTNLKLRKNSHNGDFQGSHKSSDQKIKSSNVLSFDSFLFFSYLILKVNNG